MFFLGMMVKYHCIGTERRGGRAHGPGPFQCTGSQSKKCLLEAHRDVLLENRALLSGPNHRFLFQVPFPHSAPTALFIYLFIIMAFYKVSQAFFFLSHITSFLILVTCNMFIESQKISLFCFLYQMFLKIIFIIKFMEIFTI